ncbi:MAG: trypsin-like peptidase domain-containing protein [Anaerolineae bacterium]|nr:trypsin-like peptidase domain-containing protein [Anaerolineae bacterium]
MSKNRQFPLIIFIISLLVVSLACQLTAITPAEENRDAIVADVVATVQAQQPGITASDVMVSGDETAVSQIAASDSLLEEKFTSVYRTVNPAVVHIFVYEQFEDQVFPLGTGSGFLIDTEGHIITNNHVVADGESFEVIYANGQRSHATVIGTDVDSDLAVIQAETVADDATPIPLGNSKELEVGQFVIAIGNPFGEAGSMSIGVVSGLGRTLTSEREAEGGGRYSLPQVIQTDAAINPGNSGGPLLNLDGEVIGVNSAIRTETGTNTGVGFSIPVNAVRRIAPQLIEKGSYIYPFIGIRMQTLNINTAEELNIAESVGAYVLDVSPDTPAEDAGLIESGFNNFGPLPGGDLIIAINGEPVKSSDDLISYLVFETEAGQTVDLTVVREGKEINVPLTLGERP